MTPANEPTDEQLMEELEAYGNTAEYREWAAVTVNVTGLGGAINLHMAIIEKALRDIGFDVHVTNNAANWTISAHPDWIDDMKKRVAADRDIVKLVANHQPWGG